MDAVLRCLAWIFAGLAVLCLRAPLAAAPTKPSALDGSPMAQSVPMSLSGTSAAHNGPSMADAARWVDEGKRSFQAAPLTSAAAVLTACAGDPATGFDCSYQAARAYLYLSYVYELAGHKSQARACLDPATQWAKQAVSRRPSSAGAHCVLAEVYGRRVLLGDAFTALRFGPMNGSETAAALRLAPDDPQVLEAQGLRFLYAPALFGGDPRKAQHCFEASLARADSDYVRFFLSLALAKEGQSAAARLSLLRAHGMNPGNGLVNAALAAETRP